MSASKQTTFGGVSGSPVTTQYRIKIKALRSFTLVTDSIFAENRIDRFSIVKDSFHMVDTFRLKKGKTVEIIMELKTESEMGGGNYQVKIPGSRVTKPPFSTDQGLVIRYFGGKCNYLIVKQVQKKPDILMP